MWRSRTPPQHSLVTHVWDGILFFYQHFSQVSRSGCVSHTGTKGTPTLSPQVLDGWGQDCRRAIPSSPLLNSGFWLTRLCGGEGCRPLSSNGCRISSWSLSALRSRWCKTDLTVKGSNDRPRSSPVRAETGCVQSGLDCLGGEPSAMSFCKPWLQICRRLPVVLKFWQGEEIDFLWSHLLRTPTSQPVSDVSCL